MAMIRTTNENMINPSECFEAEITHTGACVNQNAIIAEHRGATQVPTAHTLHPSVLGFMHRLFCSHSIQHCFPLILALPSQLIHAGNL